MLRTAKTVMLYERAVISFLSHNLEKRKCPDSEVVPFEKCMYLYTPNGTFHDVLCISILQGVPQSMYVHNVK